ncbi:thioredoxin-related transmembrane protein 1 isoform X2 [Seriola dumerili]|uniref:thioredoxin-related transmembrane protein 1 isoform X2 n=1 Tax=Seriola dumerili TaxID=41447 RepID=UPI000BBF098D|nr:thioredoxin-related transmembrane protein 1 isoform X2 [Seriola dumerili]
MANSRADTAMLQSKHRSWICCLFLVLQLTSLPVWAKPDSLKEVTDGNWEDILAGEWMIEFYAPWCPACQQLQSVWKEFADWGEDMGVNIAKVDVTEQPGLSGRFIITSLPTIYQMNSMSALFKLSMFIRRCHNYMTEQLGIPVWGSYVIFGLATLFSGLALGLLLVFIADFVFPSRRFSSPDYYQKKQTMEQARLIQHQEDEHEADGEEDDDEEEEYEDGDQDDVWRRRRGSPEGRPEPKGHGFSDEALRKRVVCSREEEEEEEDS